MAKEGSTVSGLMDSLATMTSLSLQYGVPLHDLVNKFSHMRFEPAGFTGNSEIPIAKSIVDYVFRWLGSRFLSKDERDALGIIARDEPSWLRCRQSTWHLRPIYLLHPLAKRQTMTSSGRPVGPKRRLSLRILLLQNRSETPTSPSNPSPTAMPTATPSPTALPSSPLRSSWAAAPRSRSASRPTHRPAPTAARSWSATAAATSASTAVAPAAAAEQRLQADAHGPHRARPSASETQRCRVVPVACRYRTAGSSTK